MIYTLYFIAAGKVCYTRLRCMCGSATQFFGGHGFMGHCFHHIRAGNKHIRSMLHHRNEICDGGRINGSSCTRTHNSRQLRNYTGSFYISVKNICVSSKRNYTFLNTGSAAVIQTNNGRAILNSEVHNFTNLFSVGF